MSDDDWTPLREWEPTKGSTVLDARSDTKGATGTVVRCDRFGHVADPHWRASVRWGGWVEQGVETSWLTRENGTQ